MGTFLKICACLLKFAKMSVVMETFEFAEIQKFSWLSRLVNKTANIQ